MGKRIIQRARGAGGPRYRCPSHRFIGKIEYFPSGNGGRIVDIVRDAIHSAPMVVVKSEEGKEILQVAGEGMHVGDNVVYGGKAEAGNIVELSQVPEGIRVFAVETYPGSGPKLCRGSGTSALVMSKSNKKVFLHFKSGTREFNDRCRVTVGIAAGGGKTDKPWISVGKRWHARHTIGKIFPRSAGVAMNATDHPYGGGRNKRPKGGKTVSRHAPPGQKVGSIAARRAGKRKGARKA